MKVIMKKIKQRLKKKLAKGKVVLGASLLLGSCTTRNKLNKTKSHKLQSISINQSKLSSGLAGNELKIIYRINNALDELKLQIGKPSTMSSIKNRKSALFSEEKNKYIEWKIKRIREDIESYSKIEKSDLSVQLITEDLNSIEKVWKKEKRKKYYKSKGFFNTKEKKKKESLETLFSRWKELWPLKEAQSDIIKDLEYDSLVSEIASRITMELNNDTDRLFIKNNSHYISLFIQKNKEKIKSEIKNNATINKFQKKQKNIGDLLDLLSIGLGYVATLGSFCCLFLIPTLSAPISTAIIAIFAVLGISVSAALASALCIFLVPIAIGGILATVSIIAGRVINKYRAKKESKRLVKNWKKVIKDIDNGENEIKYDKYKLYTH